MNKKLTKKEKHATQPQGPSQKQLAAQEQGTRRLRRTLAVIVAVVGMLVYANTIGHDYVLDDWGLIPENKLTRKGIEGIGEIFKTSYRTGMDVSDNTIYRPLSKATFAIDWQLAPNQPSIGHVGNILFFGLLCYSIFLLLVRFFKGQLLVPFLTVLLFAVHPLHTEVVANIKSRDEILALLFLVVGSMAAISYAETGKSKSLLSLAGCFFLAMLSKESSITWIAIVPLALYFFRDQPLKKLWPVIGACVVPSLLFILIRRNILGPSEASIPMLDNYLAGITNFLTQRTSAIAILGLYFYKLFVPHPLVSDGSFHHFPEYPLTDWHFLLSFVIFAAMVLFAAFRFKKKDPISFSILYFFITISITSNIVMLIGTNYAERLLFTPSLGWCLAMALLISKPFTSDNTSTSSLSLSSFFQKNMRPLAVVIVIVLAFSGLSVARNRDWKNNYTLYTQDLTKVPESAHMRFYLANHISSEEYLAEHPDSLQKVKLQLEAIAQLDTSISIYPEYSEAYQRKAFIYFSMKNYAAAEPAFQKSLELNPSEAVAHNNYGNLLFETMRYEDARKQFEQAVRYNPRYAHALNNLASIYGVFGEGEKQAAQQDPANRAMHLANAKSNYETALIYFGKAIKEDPEYAMPYQLMAVTYRNLGDEQTANTYMAKAEEVKKIKRYNASN